MTPAAKVPCVFQQLRVILVLREMVFQEVDVSRIQNSWHFAHSLSYVACGNFQVSACSAGQLWSPADVCSPQRMSNSAPWQMLPQNSDFRVLFFSFLHCYLSRRRKPLRGRSLTYENLLGKAQEVLFPLVLMKLSVVPLPHRLLQTPGILLCMEDKPTTATYVYSAPPANLAWNPGRHVCGGV